MQLDAAVQRRLSAKGEEDAVGALLLDDALDEEGRYGEEVYFVGDAFGRLHGGDVRVDEDGFDAFLAQGFQRLRAGIVELASLADFQGSGAEQEDF